MSTQLPLHQIDINDTRTKEWISITGDTDDPLYDPATYDSSNENLRQFAWRAKEDVPEHRYTDPDCPGEFLVEFAPRGDDSVGKMYAYGTGDKVVPLRIYLKLRYAAEHDTKVPVESPVRGGKVESSPGQFIFHEIGHRVKENPDAFGYENNYEEFTPGNS